MAIQLRRDTAANWASNNPIPDAGQPCYAIDTNVLKIGNGVTAYNSLPAIAGSITSIVGITGTLAQFNAAITDADIQPWDSDLAAIAALTATTDNFMQAKAGVWASRTVAQVKTDLGLTGTNSGDQTTIVGITGTMAQFNAAITDGDIQPLDSDLTTIAGLTATTDSFLQSKASAWTTRTIAQVKTDLGLTGTNSGDQTTIVGITGTMAQFNTAITDGDIQPLDSDLTTIAGLTATTDNFIQSKASAWASRTIAQVKTDLGLTGTNSGDQTTIVGITGTLAQFNTAITDANIIPEAGGIFTGDISVPAEVYGVAWDGSNEVPTKNDLYDKIQTLGAGGGTPGGADTQVQFNDASAFGGDAGLTYNKTTDVLTINGTPFGKGAGVTSVLIGPSSTAGGASAVAIGNTAVASLQQTVAIGSFPTASGASAIAIGYSAAASGDNSIAIGGNSPGATRVSSIAIGDDANANQDYSIAIGVAAGALRTTGGESGIAIGNSAQVVENFTSIAIGVGATVGSGFNNSMALGNAAQATASNQIMLGWNITQVVLGKSTAAKAVLDLTSIATNNKTFTFPNQTGTLALTANPTAITVPDEAYGGSWDGSMQVPTKNAIYDKIQTLGGGGGTILGTVGVLDNRLVRADGTGGVTAQGSLVSVSDVGTMDLPDNQGYRINGVYVASYTTGDDVMNINQFGGSILALNASTGTKFISPNLYAELNATTFRFDAYSAARVPVRIKLAASQTANALEINSSAGSGGDLFKVSAAGTVYTSKISSTNLDSLTRYVTITTTGSSSQIGGIYITPATSLGAAGNVGGEVWVEPGRGDTVSGPGGPLTLRGGQGGTPNGAGGDVSLEPGIRAGSGTYGKVRIAKPGSNTIYGTLDMSLLTASRTFTFPDADTTLGAGGGGGMAIGGAVSGGTAGAVLFLGAGGILAQDATYLNFDDTGNTLGVGNVSVAGGITINSQATLGAFNGALSITSGTNLIVASQYNANPGVWIHPDIATTKGLIIKLVASHSANAFEINTVSGSGGDVFKIAANGEAVLKPTSSYGYTVDSGAGYAGYGQFNALNSPDNGAIISSNVWTLFRRGAAAHYSANSSGLHWFNTYTHLAELKIDTSAATNNLLWLSAGVATNVPLRIKLASTPTANAFEIDSSGGSGGDIFKIDAAGSVNIPAGQSYKVNGVAIGGGGGMAIGGAVSGGTANRVLFLDGSANLDDTADFKFDDTTKLLNVFGSDSGGQVHIGKLAASFGGIWFGQSAPDTTNYAFLGNTGSTIFNSTTALNFRIGNVNNAALDTNMCWVFGYAGTPQDASTTMTIKPGNAAYKGLAIKLMASQTGNAFEINSVSGSGGDLLRFDGYNLTSTGQFRAGGGGAGYGFSSIAGSHLYLCTSGNDGYIGFGNTNGQMTLSVLDLMPTKLSMRVRRFHWYAETPAQITSNQNDYQITYSSTMHRLSSDASRDITGIDSYASGWGGHMADSGEVHVLINVGSFPIVLKHESASSTAAYRMTNSTGADITLAPNQSIDLIYDGTTSRWRVRQQAPADGGPMASESMAAAYALALG